MTAPTPNAAQPKPRRRWYQFTLRTLLIGIVALSLPLAWLGWQVRIIHEREAIRHQLEARGFMFFDGDGEWGGEGESSVPWYRHLLGDRNVAIGITPSASPDDVWLMRTTFPEAWLYKIPKWGSASRIDN